MNQIPFIKMHGLGNDFVVIDARETAIDLPETLIRWIGDRHRGVGFDQLVVVEAADDADAHLRFFNTDGTKAGACGNATRCVGAWLANAQGKTRVIMRSVAGHLPARILPDGLVEVEMTTPRIDWQEIPVAQACDTLAMPVVMDDLPAPVGVNMGNPHAVFFVEDVDLIETYGERLERHSFFPDRANIGFAHVRNRTDMRLRVFERGAGLTLACGSGACAAHVAAFRRGLVDARTVIELDGGALQIEWAGEGPVKMTGPVAISYRGLIDMTEVGL